MAFDISKVRNDMLTVFEKHFSGSDLTDASKPSKGIVAYQIIFPKDGAITYEVRTTLSGFRSKNDKFLGDNLQFKWGISFIFSMDTKYFISNYKTAEGDTLLYKFGGKNKIRWEDVINDYVDEIGYNIPTMFQIAAAPYDLFYGSRKFMDKIYEISKEEEANEYGGVFQKYESMARIIDSWAKRGRGLVAGDLDDIAISLGEFLAND